MKSFFKILLLFIILCQFVTTEILSQSTNLHFDHITIDDGLSQSTVYCMIQDSDGFMWFGTQGGLNKYIGYAKEGFEWYKHAPGDKNSLSSNWVLSVAEDSQGNIWCGTTLGLNRLHKRTGVITRFVHDPIDPGSLNDDIVYSVLIDDEGYVWAKTSNALNRLDTVTGVFSVFPHDIVLFSKYSNVADNSYPIFQDENKNIWVGSAYGLFMFNREYEQFKRYKHLPANENSLSHNFVSAFVKDRNGDFWVGTENGLNKFETKSNKWIRFFHDPENTNSLSDNSISAIIEDHNNNLWIATKNGGLNFYDIRKNKFSSYRATSNNPSSIGGDNILSLYEDDSKILWIGTEVNSIDKVDMKKKKFELYKRTGDEQSIDLSSNIIASIYKENDSIIWIGTWFNGLNRYNRNSGDVHHYNEASPGKDRIVNNYVHSILKDSKGRLMIGTRGGISVYENEEKGFKSIEDYFPPNVVPKLSNRIFALVEDRYENIWAATEKGLHRFSFNSGEVKSFYKSSNVSDPSDNISGNKVQALLEDHEGYMWIGTDKGLCRYNPLTGKFLHYRTGENIANSLSNNIVYSIIEGKDKVLWVGTASGLNKFNWRDTTFVYYTKDNGLSDDKIYEILEDNKGILWFSTDRGIIRLNPETEEIRSYDKDNGLQSLEFNNGASHKSYDGELFFGGISGLNSFYPDSMTDNEIIPPVILTTFERRNNERTVIENLMGREEIVISYVDFMFTISFAALEYTNPEKNQYMYKMDGLNDNWIYLKTEHSRTFSNIPPGEYVFHVKGSNNDLIWNEQEASIKIIIKPPWWKSRWAIISYILIVGLIIYYFIELRTRKLKKSNMVLREKQLAALEIAKQKEELTIKNKNITDSINYAKRIQEAMMPSVYLFKKLFADSFIYYKPKDIVSGDFYWISEQNNKIFIAAVDCTGHGVPGAFMSIIGYDLIRNIIQQGTENPAQILNELNDGVANIFDKNVEDETVKDGMDVSLCVVDQTNNTLEFSGAMNPLYLARNNKIIEVKGNRFSVGTVSADEENTFESHTIQIQEDDVVYIFTDGYPDQFGGPLGKKFQYRRFRHLLLTIHNLPVDQQRTFLDENIINWQGELEQIDDILVIGVKMTS